MASRRLENTYGVAFSFLTPNLLSKYADPMARHWKPRCAVNIHRRFANINRNAISVSIIKSGVSRFNGNAREKGRTYPNDRFLAVMPQ